MDHDPEDPLITPAEQELLVELSQVLADGTPPADLVSICGDLIQLRDLDATIAAILLDDADLAVGVRSAATDQSVPAVYEARDGSLAVEVTVDERGVAVAVYPSEDVVVLLDGTGSRGQSGERIGDGQWRFSPHSSGPVRVRVIPLTGAEVATEWFMS